MSTLKFSAKSTSSALPSWPSTWLLSMTDYLGFIGDFVYFATRLIKTIIDIGFVIGRGIEYN